MSTAAAATKTTKKTRKKRVVRAAFVVTASLSAIAAAAGCGSEIITNPPPPDCPEQQPAYDSDCDNEGDSCSYGPDECGNEVIATCTDGAWDVQYEGTCNPPPPECPEAEPAHGEACDEWNSCTYYDECGSSYEATCDGATWDVGIPDESCNPPAPCPVEMPADRSPCYVDDFGYEECSYEARTACGVQTVAAECVYDKTGEGGYYWQLTAPECTPTEPACSGYSDPALCDADTTCRWLVPGCGPEPEVGFAEGCYPAADCTAETCGEDQECAAVTYDPCWNSFCDACGAEANLCIPTMGGA